MDPRGNIYRTDEDGPVFKELAKAVGEEQAKAKLQEDEARLDGYLKGRSEGDEKAREEELGNIGEPDTQF